MIKKLLKILLLVFITEIVLFVTENSNRFNNGYK